MTTETLTAERLTWAATGALNSLDHVAEIAPWQNVALCGTGIAGTKEIQPRTLARLCPRCARELRKLQIDPQEIGLENDLL